MKVVDLSGGIARVIGNRGDAHQFLLSNPVGTNVIEAGGTYSASFFNAAGVESSVDDLDVSQISDGKLTLPVTIADGKYKVYRTTPQWTLITLIVEAR